MKYYDVRYKSKADRVFNDFLIIFSIPFYPVIFFMITYVILGLFKVNIPLKIGLVCVALCFIIGYALVIKYFTALKGIFLYDDYLEISMHLPNRWFVYKSSIKVKYDEITECDICIKSHENYNERYFNWKLGSCKDYYVKIVTKYDKIYCFCVENQNELVEEVNKRRLALQENDVNEQV